MPGVLLVLVACDLPGHTPPPVAPLAETGFATPAVVRVVNDTDTARSFDVTFGPHQPFGVGRLDGELDPSASFGPCVCACGAPCPSAARPEQQTVRLEPGAAHEFAWDGRLVRSGGDLGQCCESFAPPAGSYVVTACADDGGCARTEVTLPAQAPVVVSLGAASTAATCATLDLALHQDAVARFVAELGPMLSDRPVSECPPARCVESGDLVAALDLSRDRACTVVVIPRGAEVETLAFLPLPPGHDGGERYARFTDPDFTRVFRVRYEQ